jgi:hypothetical protein
MKKILIATAIGGALLGGSLVSTGTAHAGRIDNCQYDPWGFLGLTKQRMICDGPILPDGSWWRHRRIARPDYYQRSSSSCDFDYYGGVYCTRYDGGWVAGQVDDDETYLVRPDTVLPDEPVHLG